MQNQPVPPGGGSFVLEKGKLKQVEGTEQPRLQRPQKDETTQGKVQPAQAEAKPSKSEPKKED